jgi:hypothetical protein
MRKTLALTALATIFMLGAAMPSNAETVTAGVLGGALSLTSSPVVFSNTSLDGSNQTLSAQPLVPWTVLDARGTGAAWTSTISASDFISAAGTVDTTQRTFPASSLKVSVGSPTAGLGSDPITNITGASNLPLSGSAQTLMSSTGASKGLYTFTPTFTLTVPANAYRPNYAGNVGVSATNAYVSTLTLTIA